MKKSLPKNLLEAINSYWDIAYLEGLEKRTHDTPQGSAQNARNVLENEIKEYAQNTQSLFLKLSSDDLWESKELMSLNARLGLRLEDLQEIANIYKNIVLKKSEFT